VKESVHSEAFQVPRKSEFQSSGTERYSLGILFYKTAKRTQQNDLFIPENVYIIKIGNLAGTGLPKIFKVPSITIFSRILLF
jgi:hypothetical protein